MGKTLRAVRRVGGVISVRDEFDNLIMPTLLDGRSHRRKTITGRKRYSIFRKSDRRGFGGGTKRHFSSLRYQVFSPSRQDKRQRVPKNHPGA